MLNRVGDALERWRDALVDHPAVTQSLPRMGRTLKEYALLIRLHRPIGLWLLLWPTLWGLWLSAAGKPNEHVFIVFVLGVVLMRSAGCAINDFADRDFDGAVHRTRERPLAMGRIAPLEALIVFAALSLIALALVMTLDTVTQLYAVAAAGLAVVYPFLKRFFSLPQFWLGAAFGWGIPMAFTAHTGAVPRIGWLLFLANVLWSAVYDTMYAMVDRADDLRIGVRSTAILFGDADRLIIGVMQLMVLYALYLVGRDLQCGHWYFGAVAFGGLLFAYQQWLIRRRNPEQCFAAFRNNNWFGLVIFVGIALDYLFR